MSSPEKEPSPTSTLAPSITHGAQKGAEETADTTLEAYRRRLVNDQRLKAARGLHPVRSGLSLAWHDLNVRGLGGKDEMIYGDDLGSLLAGPFGAAKDKKRAARLAALRNEGESGMAKHDETLKPGERYLLRNLGGVVKAGEMMLVLGRPGAGSTTFLKTVAGLTDGYSGVDGSVLYGNLDSKDKKLKPMQGQIVFNADEEAHLPNLQVGRTLDFALSNSTPSRESRTLAADEATVPSASETDASEKESLLKIFGLSHTHDTKVGDAYVRGVSGGQRKRVSLAEMLASRPSISLWDKPTRGLDANTALEYAKIMRVLADVEQRSISVSLYQAGNAITKLFDKVLVLSEGQAIYYGPMREAQGYMESLGFEMLDGANVSDFLSAVTAPRERRIRADFDGRVPNTTADFVQAYQSSSICRRMQEELQQHLADEAALKREVDDTLAIVQREKHKRALKSQPHNVSLVRQVRVALKREFLQRSGARFEFWARQLTTAVMSLVVGSAFYQLPQTSSSLFLRGGAALLSFIYPCILALAETTASFEARGVIAKHNGYKMFRPTALVIAQTLADIPIFLPSLFTYAAVIYWMAGFKSDAGAFFTFFLFMSTTTLSMTSFFRMVGAAFDTFEDASKISGIGFTLLATYCGYFITVPTMKPWFAWTRWISPLYYGLESTVSNEIGGRTFGCDQLVPAGPGYTSTANQGCTAPGAAPGSMTVDGDDYLRLALHFYKSHVWRNLAGILGLWLAFVLLNFIISERTKPAGSKKAFLLYTRGGGDKFLKEAEQGDDSDPADGEKHKEEDQADGPSTSNSIFTWKDLNYTVKAGGSDLTLLSNVQGWCKPGELTALMGSSGAGKTTLLDVLAQRKDSGEVTGEVLINGQALPISFQRTTGYVEQVDVHLPQATVREALQFSALLRQPRSVPDKEKLAYVDTIIDLLELHDIEDAIVGVPGAGLGVEQRKRLTIGVELVAKPRLLFADEPTSGLDGSSSYVIVQFLRKLAAAGQAVICVVHQPSKYLFTEFDSLLLLKAGGRTVYFGSTKDMPAYFNENGVSLPRDANPAEWMIDVVSGDLARDRDWAEVWLASKQYTEVTEELERLKKVNEHIKTTNADDAFQFAAREGTQMKLVLHRANTQIYRQVDYVMNKIALHVGIGLLNGLSWFKLGSNPAGLQNRLFTSFAFLFVAPGVIAQMQPKFIANRDLYETREKKAKMYTWRAFILSEIIAEIPYLLICGTLFAVCWLPPTGISFKPSIVGPLFLEIYIYELLYTGIGQAIAAYAPTPAAAAVINPIVIGTLVLFNGAFIPYRAMQVFWRSWLYWMNPFKYVMNALMVFPLWNQKVTCQPQDFGRFVPPAGQTCAEYMRPFLSLNPGYLNNPAAVDSCEYCPYSTGADFLKTLNISRRVYGWRDLCITVIFVLSSYGLVFLMMKARTKQTKAAKAKKSS